MVVTDLDAGMRKERERRERTRVKVKKGRGREMRVGKLFTRVYSNLDCI